MRPKIKLKKNMSVIVEFSVTFSLWMPNVAKYYTLPLFESPWGSYLRLISPLDPEIWAWKRVLLESNFSRNLNLGIPNFPCEKNRPSRSGNRCVPEFQRDSSTPEPQKNWDVRFVQLRGMVSSMTLQWSSDQILYLNTSLRSPNHAETVIAMRFNSITLHL